MKKHLTFSTILLALGVFLFAQEKTEISMKVIKNGKIVKDTTYAFDDVKKAKHVIHMFDAMASGKLDVFVSGDHDHMEVIHNDGKWMKHEKKEGKMEGSSYKYVIRGDGEEKVLVVKKDLDAHGHTYVSTDDADGNVKVIIKEFEDDGDEEGQKKVIEKKIMLLSEDGDEGSWTMKKGKDGEEVLWKKIAGEDGEVIIIKKIKGEGDEEEIEVEVISAEMIEKKMKKKEQEIKEEEVKKKMDENEMIEKKEKKKSKK